MCLYQVVTNSKASGDWLIVRNAETGEHIFEGHAVTARDLVDILSSCANCDGVEYVEVDDNEIGSF